MNVYLDPLHIIKNSKGERLEKILSKFGVQVVNPYDISEQQSEKIQVFLIDGTNDSSDNTYISALAIAKKKKVICFLPKGRRLPPSLSLLNTNPILQKKITLIHYTPEKLNKVVRSLLKQLDNGQLKEKPSIKFTLRITPSMERYLEWKSRSLQESKADFLRKAIKESIIDQDKDYDQMID